MGGRGQSPGWPVPGSPNLPLLLGRRPRALCHWGTRASWVSRDYIDPWGWPLPLSAFSAVWNGREVEPHQLSPHLATPNTQIRITDIHNVIEGNNLPSQVIDLLRDLINAGGTRTQVIPTAVVSSFYMDGGAKGTPHGTGKPSSSPSGRWRLGVADQRSATLLFVDTSEEREWRPDIQVLNWLERKDPEGRTGGQGTLNGSSHSMTYQNSGVNITAFMLQVARGEGLPLSEDVLENEVQDIRGRLAGMMIFCMLDPPEDLHEFAGGLETLLSYR